MMQKVLHMMRWDMLLQLRAHIYTVTAFTALTVGLVAYLLIPLSLSTKWLAIVLFADPAIIGLAFTGAFILMERDGKTLSALGVTPLQGWVYVSGKVFSFALLGTLAGAAIAMAATLGQLNYPLMGFSLIMTNITAALIGFALVARANSVNAFLVNLSVTMVILTIPLLGFFDLVPPLLGSLLALIPSYSMLIMLEAGFEQSVITSPQYILHALYLLVWVIAGWMWGAREYSRTVRIHSL